MLPALGRRNGFGRKPALAPHLRRGTAGRRDAARKAPRAVRS